MRCLQMRGAEEEYPGAIGIAIAIGFPTKATKQMLAYHFFKYHFFPPRYHYTPHYPTTQNTVPLLLWKTL